MAMQEGNRGMLRRLLEENEDVPTLLIKTMLIFDMEYMIQEYPEYVIKYPRDVSQTMKKVMKEYKDES